MVSELSIDNIWPIFWQKKRWNRLESWFQQFFPRIFGQNRGQIWSKLNSETTFRILSSMRTFYAPNMKKGWKIHFLATPVLKKSVVREPKKQILWEKNWHYFVIHIPWCGIGSENQEKWSRSKTKRPTLQWRLTVAGQPSAGLPWRYMY